MIPEGGLAAHGGARCIADPDLGARSGTTSRACASRLEKLGEVLAGLARPHEGSEAGDGVPVLMTEVARTTVAGMVGGVPIPITTEVSRERWLPMSLGDPR